MHHDPRGTPRTIADPLAASRFEAALTSFLGQRADTALRTADALAHDPDMVVGHGLAGFLAMLSARADQHHTAAEHRMLAQSALATRGGTVAEHALITALEAWQSRGDMWDAVTGLEAGLAAAPRDLLLLRLSHAMRFMLGDATGMRASLERVLPAWSDETPGMAYVLGCHAFALGETGEFARAEQVGQRAVAMEPTDLWGAHAVAHAMGAQKRPREGIAWIAWLEPHMACGGGFVRHIQWHRALCHIRLGEFDQALSLYDRRVRDTPSLEVRDILNAASLLWRLEAAGVSVGPLRWEELADIATTRIGENAWSFADLHYVLCLAAAGRHDTLATMLASLGLAADRAATTQGRIMADVGLAAAHAIAATDAAQAAMLLSSVEPDWRRLGGSNTQRDLLRQMRARAERDGAQARHNS